MTARERAADALRRAGMPRRARGIERWRHAEDLKDAALALAYRVYLGTATAAHREALDAPLELADEAGAGAMVRRNLERQWAAMERRFGRGEREAA
jgi:hypothetical protein